MKDEDWDGTDFKMGGGGGGGAAALLELNE